MCPNDCNWNYTNPQGECLYDKCVCYPGFSGEDCSVATALSEFQGNAENVTAEPCSEDPRICAAGTCSAFHFSYWTKRWNAEKQHYVRNILNVTIGTGYVHPFVAEVLAALGHPLPPEERSEESKAARDCYLRCVRDLAVRCESDLQSLGGLLRQKVLDRISSGQTYRGLTGDLVTDIGNEFKHNSTEGEDFRVYDVAHSMRKETSTTEGQADTMSSAQELSQTFENPEYAEKAVKEAIAQVAHGGGTQEDDG